MILCEGDSLSYHNNQPFSTHDVDTSEGICARKEHGAWWYNDCKSANLNGAYVDGFNLSYVIWDKWMGLQSLKFTEMKFRPANFKYGK